MTDDLGPFKILICRGQNYALECKLSPQDYDWAVEQGNWFVTHGARIEDRSGPVKSGYAVRSGPDGLIWLHKEVLIRDFRLPPSARHTIGDHWNGNRLDDRRGNLRWATHQMNARNIFGFASRQMELSL